MIALRLGSRSLPLPAGVPLAIAYVILYVALDWVSALDPQGGPLGITPWNPPPGLSLFLLLRFGLAFTPWLFVASLVAELVVRGMPASWPLAIATCVLFTGGYAGMAALLRGPLRFDAAFTRMRDVSIFAGLALVTTLVVALAYVGLYRAAFGIPQDDAWHSVVEFWIGDLIGLIVTTPFLLAFTQRAIAATKAVAGLGRAGLAYIDGHSDFRHDANLLPLRKDARSDLACAVGRSVDGTTLSPHFRDADTATIGFKRDDEAFLELRKTEILLWPMYWLYEHSRLDLEESLKRRFHRAELEAIWIHLDLDALDPKLLPGVATPIDDGLSAEELVPILRILLATGKVAGMSVSNLTPELLADEGQAQIVADALARAFGPSCEADKT